MVAVDLVCALGKVFTMLEYWVQWLGFTIVGVLGTVFDYVGCSGSLVV